MRHMPWKELGWAVGVVAALLVLYIVAYGLLVSNVFHPMAFPERTKAVDPERPNFRRIKPEYRFGGDHAEAFFAPIHEVDAAWRYDTWHFTAFDPPSTKFSRP